MNEISEAFHLHLLWHVAKGPRKMNASLKLWRRLINTIMRGSLYVAVNTYTNTMI